MNLSAPKLPSPPLLSARQDGGTTLLFVLIMLLVVSIIGVSAARSTLMQEKMSSNTNISNIVFEAAESALAEGEAKVANTEKIWETIPKGKQCSEGVCRLSTEIEPRWMNTGFWNNDKDGVVLATEVIQTNQDGTEIKIEPKYTIEDLGQTMATCDPDHIDVTRSSDCPYLSSQRFFRVVGFARNNRTNTEVTVQSMYLDPRSIRTELEPMDLTSKPTKYICDDGKEYITGISTCCPDSNGKTIFYLGTSCPEMCNGVEVKSGQKCCNDGATQYIHSGDECPKFCGPNREKYLPSIQNCCDAKIVQTPESQGCPQYCDGQVHDGTKQCCTDPVTKKESLQDSCQKYCGNENIGWTALKPGENACCDTSQSSTPFNNTQQKCCADVNGINALIPLNGSRNCPNYCGSSRQSYEPWNNQGCCSGQVYNTTTHGCCNGVLHDKKVHTCCFNKQLARIGSEECCGSTGTVVSIGNCPVFCQNGNIPKKTGDQCCASTPYNPTTAACCSGREIYNREQNKCCQDANTRWVVMPGPENKGCPNYCGNQELQLGMECCNNIEQKPSGTCKDFCWDTSNINGAAGVGVAGPCKYPGGGIGG